MNFEEEKKLGDQIPADKQKVNREDRMEEEVSL